VEANAVSLRSQNEAWSLTGNSPISHPPHQHSGTAQASGNGSPLAVGSSNANASSSNVPLSSTPTAFFYQSGMASELAQRLRHDVAAMAEGHLAPPSSRTSSRGTRNKREKDRVSD
jgi:hypothetical protein